jgi:hypothetical protein
VPYSVLNYYCPKQLVCNDFKASGHFCSFMIRIIIIN